MSYPNWFSISVPSGVTGKQIVSANTNSWLLTDAGQIHIHSNGSWNQISSPAEKLVSLQVATDLSAIAIGEYSGIYNYNLGSWNSLGLTGTAAAIGDSSHYIVANGSHVTAYESFSSRDISTNTFSLKQISATEMLQHVWGVDTNGTIHSLVGNSWIPVPGPPGVTVASVDVSLSSGNLQAYCTDTFGTGYWYNANGSWTDVYNPTYWAHGFASLEGGAGYAHALMTNGEVFIGNI